MWPPTSDRHTTPTSSKPNRAYQSSSIDSFVRNESVGRTDESRLVVSCSDQRNYDPGTTYTYQPHLSTSRSPADGLPEIESTSQRSEALALDDRLDDNRLDDTISVDRRFVPSSFEHSSLLSHPTATITAALSDGATANDALLGTEPNHPTPSCHLCNKLKCLIVYYN